MRGRVRNFRATGRRHIRTRPDYARTDGRRENVRRRSNGLLPRETTPVYQGTYFGI